MNDHLDQGDVAETVKLYFEKSNKLRPQATSTMSIQEVDAYLEQMSKVTREDDQQSVLTAVAKRCVVHLHLSADTYLCLELSSHDRLVLSCCLCYLGCSCILHCVPAFTVISIWAMEGNHMLVYFPLPLPFLSAPCISPVSPLHLPCLSSPFPLPLLLPTSLLPLHYLFPAAPPTSLLGSLNTNSLSP